METNKTKQRQFNYRISIGIVGSLLFITCVAFGIGIGALLEIYSIRFFYSLQVGLLIILVGFVVGILMAIKKHTLGDWTTYIPLMILAIYVVGVFATSRLIVMGYAIPTKINNPDNRVWSEAMVSRALGGWDSPACVLGNQVGVLIGIWSFITPDGHMPVLAYSENSYPDSKLLGDPTSCTQLQANWYICYLSKPYQLVNQCH